MWVLHTKKRSSPSQIVCVSISRTHNLRDEVCGVSSAVIRRSRGHLDDYTINSDIWLRGSFGVFVCLCTCVWHDLNKSVQHMSAFTYTLFMRSGLRTGVNHHHIERVSSARFTHTSHNLYATQCMVCNPGKGDGCMTHTHTRMLNI